MDGVSILIPITSDPSSSLVPSVTQQIWVNVAPLWPDQELIHRHDQYLLIT